MLNGARKITGGAALALYVVMGGLLWVKVIPGAGGHWPPDFRALGYDAADIAPFVSEMTVQAIESYSFFLRVLDPAFIVMLVVWITLMGWRAPIVRGVVALLAATYGVLDLAEDRTLCELICAPGDVDPALVNRASAYTQAKFASLFSALMGVLWAILREREMALRDAA